MLSLRLEASASVYDWVDPNLESEPFGRGGAAILIDMTILVCTQIETWAPSAPWPNWTYEIRHYDQHLNLLGMATTGPAPFESFGCYFVPIGGTNALLMISNGDSSKTYHTAFVSASGAVPTIGSFTTRTSTITDWWWGRNASRCQFIDAWSAIVLANGNKGIHVLSSSGAEIQVFTNSTEFIGVPLAMNQRGDDLFLTTYTTTSGYQMAEWKLTRVTFSSYTLTKTGDYMSNASLAPVDPFDVWGLALAGTSTDPQMLSWRGEYFGDPGGGFSSKFRWFVVADATTGTELDRQDMTIIGDMDTGYSSAVALYPVEEFYSAVNHKVGETYFAGQLGGAQNSALNGVAGLYPSFAIHVIGVDSVTGEQRYVDLPIPGVHGEQDTLSAGSVTFSMRNHRWVVTCCNVNLDNFSEHDFYSFSVWTGSAHSLAQWDGTKWRIIGDEADTESGRQALGDTDTTWVEEIRAGEGDGEQAVIPLYLDDTTGHGAPWFSTSASGYPQASGWIPRTDPALSGLVTYVGTTPYIDQPDEVLNYVAISQSLDLDGNLIFLSTFWEPYTPTGEIINAWVEFQFRAHGGSGDPELRWGISGADYYQSNFDTGTEPGTNFQNEVWRTHRMVLFNEQLPARTKAEFISDLEGGFLNAGMNMDRAFDVSAIRLIVQYADETTKPLKMWHPDAVGTFAGWVEVARMRPKP